MPISLEVSKRKVRPRSLGNKLHHEGKVPAVVYRCKVESASISPDGLTLNKLSREHGANTVITTDIGGQKISTLVHKIRTNTFADHSEHAEFLFVNISEEAGVETEVILVNESVGTKSDEMLAQNSYTVVVSATPDRLPKRIEVDVANLELGDSITVANLPKSDDYKFVTDSEEQIAIIVAQSEEEEGTGKGGEPEVIGSAEG